MIKKLVHTGLNNDDADYLENLKKQKKHIFKKSFKNSIKNTIFGILCIILSLLIILYNLRIKELSLSFLMLSFIIQFTGFIFLLPFYHEYIFFRLYYKTYYSIMHLLYSKQKEKYDSYLENFQINYNELRKQMKKQIISSKRNFLTYDHEINRIVHEIDTFFDSTILILFKRHTMDIPYLPREEIEQYLKDELEETARQYHMDDQKFDDFIPYDRSDPDNYNINEINFESIKEFMRIYGKLIIKNSRKKSINTVAIAELFRKWNSIVNQLEPEIFEQSKKDVDKYYSKKQERQNYLFSKAYEIFVIFLITIISGILLNVFL